MRIAFDLDDTLIPCQHAFPVEWPRRFLARLFAADGPSKGKCEGGAKVFDGRRSYTLTLSPADVAAELVDVGDNEVQALKCTITSYRTGGKSPDGILSSSDGTENATIWFWTDTVGYAVPVRIEADAPVGYAVAQLVELPKQ